jgi:hypothetical protein
VYVEIKSIIPLAIIILISGCICCNCGKEYESCHEIPDEIQRNICIYDEAQSAKDHNACDGISDSLMRDECLYWISASADRFILCEKIGNETLRGDCYTLTSMRSKNPRPCSNIIAGETRSWCEFLSPALPQKCDQELTKGTVAHTNCITWMAVANKNTLICERLPAEKIQSCKDLTKQY